MEVDLILSEYDLDMSIFVMTVYILRSITWG